MSEELVDDVITEALHHINRKSIEHSISVESKEEFLLAKMDARLIVQVIINIVDNAIKYTPENSHIVIKTEKQGNKAVISISDDGAGIPDELKPRIFDMFYSGANQIADSRRSLGLGLSLCKSIIHAHGGEIKVSDKMCIRDSLYTYSAFSAKQAGIDNPTSITTLVALLVCLAPTTIGALLSAIGIAGMSRLNQANVLAMSGRAIEAAGDVDILMLDKTGTITLGNRQAHAFIPVDGTSEEELADAAQLSSLADETPEGRSVVILAKEKYGIRGRELSDKHMTFVPFTAKTRMSGVDFDGNEIRKGAAESMQLYVTHAGGLYSCLLYTSRCV